jgi:hypothetical protein
VYAGFSTEIAVGVRSLHRDGGALDAGALTGLDIDQRGFEAVALGPAQVHAQQHLGPILRFGAASARVQGHDRVAGVVLAAELALQLEPVERFRHLAELRPGLRFGVGVTLGRQLGEYLGVFQAFELFAPRAKGLVKF